MNIVLSTWNLDRIRRRWPLVEMRLARAPRVNGVVVTPEGTLELAGSRLASAGDRRQEAAIQADNIPEDAPEVWVYGAGLGDLPRYLLERPLLQRLHVIILNEALFATLLDYTDHSDWLEDSRVSLELDPPQNTLSHPFCVQPACLRSMPDQGVGCRLKALLHLELSSGYINRDFSDNPVMRRRLNLTAPLLGHHGDVSQLYHSHPGGIILVAGAGPSLAQQLPWVGAGRQQFTLIATSGALRPLLKANIVPDVVVAVDPFPILMAQFDVDLAPVAEVPLVCFPILDPAIIARWPGPKLVACSANPLYQEWQLRYPQSILHSGGSAIHPALDLAVRMDGQHIILLGCDFAFPRGQIRDKHSPELSFGILSGGDIELTNGHGATVKTVASFRQYLLETEFFISLHPTVKFINASREGARIQGCSYLDKVARSLAIRLVKHNSKPAPLPLPITVAEAEARLATAVAALRRWQLVEAASTLEGLRRSVRAGGSPLLEARLLLALAEVGLERGRLAEAQEPLREITTLKPQGWNNQDEITLRRLSAWCSLQEGNSVAAGKDLDVAMALSTNLGLLATQSAVHRMVCQFYVHLGRYEDGLGHLQQARHWAQEMADPWEQCRCLRQQGDIYVRRQELELAHTTFCQALHLLENLENAAVLQADIRNQLFFLELEGWKATQQDTSLLASCCRALRRGEEAWAYDLLVKWIDTLIKHPQRLSNPGVQKLLPTVIACQRRRDGIALADILEFALAPLLKGL